VKKLAGLCLLLGAYGCDRRPVETTLYPTYGYQAEAGGAWTIPVLAYVHSPREGAEGLLESIAAKFGRSGREREIFHDRIADLVADSRSGKEVRFVFDGDPRREEFRIAEAGGGFLETDLNGLVDGTITLAAARAAEIREAQGSTDGWLTVTAVSPAPSAGGRIRLIAAEGRSVVSDIDDTIKITEIPAGPEIVFKNTFLREFAAAPGMADRYRGLAGEGAVFHYVSGGPWQLYRPLAALLGEAGYPEGTFHMKSVSKNLLAAGTWEGLAKLAQGDATFDQKVEQISELLDRFPGRRFTLIGDSGEKDPEVFRAIRDEYGPRVERIYIRHVLPDPPGERLAGMEIIPAEPVLPGVSGLGD
jgi:hypothetical protein